MFKDITSGKITNPSFEAANATIAETNATGDLTTGWKITAIDYARIAIFDNDDTPTSNTYGSSNPSNGSYYLMVRSNLTDYTRTQNIQQKDAFSLPYGTYQISYDYKAAKCSSYAMSFTISAKDGSTTKGSKQTSISQVAANTSHFSEQNWTEESFNFSLTETKDITLDISCTTRGVSSGHTVILLDNFILKWNLTKSLTDLLSDANTFYDEEGTSYTALKSAIDAADAVKESSDASTLETQYNALAAAFDLAKNHRKPWLAAWTTANTNYASATYVNVTGTEKTALKTEIDKSEPSTASDYNDAATDLTDANAAFIAAKTNYDALVAEIAKAKALGIDDATADGYAATSLSTSESVATSTKNLKVAEYTFVSTNYTESLTLAEGDWVTSTIKTETKSEHWDDVTSSYKSSDGWDSYWNASFSQDLVLPAGQYVFKVAGRRSNSSAMSIEVKNGGTTLGSANDFPKADSGLGINTSGETDFTTGAGHTYANSGEGRGWEWRYVKFSLTEKATVTVTIKGSSGSAHNYINFTNYTVLTNSDLNVSLYEYFKAYNSAISARDNATYTNVDGEEKADLLAAIATDASLDKTSKTDVDAATTALANAKTAFTNADAVTNYNALVTAISNAQAIVDANKNVGSGVFQIPSSAQTTLSDAITTASGIKSNTSKTKDDASTAATTLNGAIATYNATELNAPDPLKKYIIKVKTAGHAKLGNAIKVSLGETGTSNPTGYTFNASSAPAPYLANNYQSFKFTKVSGNNYKITIDGPSGTVYLTNGDKNGSTAGHKVNQIQANSDSEKAMEFRFAPSTNDGAFVIYNTEANATIACESGGSIYTTSGNADFSIEEAVASVPITIAADVKFATRIFPFTPVLPSGVKAYSCGAKVGDALTLVEVPEPAANTPYILYAASGYTGAALTGYGTATTDSYTEGYLTGVYTATDAPVGSYVLQNNGGVSFYKVADSKQPSVGAYRCYLTAPTSARSLTFNFGDETTAIETIKALTSGKKTIYNAAGAEVPTLQKGLNIIKMEDGTTRKIMVK